MSETWNALLGAIKNAKNEINICGLIDSPDDSLVVKIGITEKSPLGSILKYSHGVTVNKSILRMFGGKDSEFVESIHNWINIPGEEIKENIPINALIFAYDVWGGFFAINGGDLGPEIGKVFYFAPDLLTWENMDIGHSQFISWCLDGDVSKYYSSFRWNNDEELISKIKRGEVISSYPFLWTKEGKDLNKTEKKIVPLKELWNMYIDMKKNLAK